MKSNTRKAIVTTAKYILLIIVGIIMIYPLVWMVSASFKTNSEIFTSLSLIPQNPTRT